MFEKNFENINFEDIESLVSQSVTENQLLEYKEQVWGKGEPEKKEMLKDITSMANKYGGYFVIGIREGNSGEAKELVNVDDAETRRDEILSTIFSSVQPRIPLKIKILTNNGVSVMLINIPNSYRKPHIITFQNINQFWVRHDRQKMFMNIHEIEEAFLYSSTQINNVESFFQSRKLEVAHEVSGISPKPTMLLGVYPIVAGRRMIDVSDLIIREKLKSFETDPLYKINYFGSHNNPRPSYNGLLLEINESTCLELYRSGYIDARIIMTEHIQNGSSSRLNNIPIINSYFIIKYLYSFLEKTRAIYNYLGYDGQIAVYLCFFNIKGKYLLEGKSGSTCRLQNETMWNGGQFLEIKDFVYDELNVVKISKELGDRIWQSFGFEREPFFDSSMFNFD